jgi:hypothetical protein
MGKTNQPRAGKVKLGSSSEPRLFHHITVFFISETEKATFCEAGVEFKSVSDGPRGQAATFEIGEDDPRWARISELLASLEGNDQVSQKHRVQDISMTHPTFGQSVRASLRHFLQDTGPALLSEYSGQSIEQLLSLEGQYRIDSLVLAFEEAVSRKVQREGTDSVSHVERTILAVEALEREVNNGGYDQFFRNSSREYVGSIVHALERIGCIKAAKVTQTAINALNAPSLDVEAIDIVMTKESRRRRGKFETCDAAYFENDEPIAERLFEFIKRNKDSIRI